MEEWIKKSEVLELLGLPLDILAEYIYELKGVWVDKDWNEWIPCSERLPKETDYYLVTGQWKGEERKTWICEFLVLNSAFGGGWCNHAKNPVVDAWMPLPEPYKE